MKTISRTKQFSGYEVGIDVFRFFGFELFDVNFGAKAQEPLQLGIRAALEEATLKLVASVTQTDPAPCLNPSGPRLPAIAAAAVPAAPAAPPPSPPHASN